MGRASKSRAPSEYEYWNPELERVRASALILGPSFDRVWASFSSIPHIVNANFFSPRICKKSWFLWFHFLLHFYAVIFYWNFFSQFIYRGENIFGAVIFTIWIPWCSPSTLRASTPSTSEYEHVLGLQNPSPSTIKNIEYRASIERACARTHPYYCALSDLKENERGVWPNMYTDGQQLE